MASNFNYPPPPPPPSAGHTAYPSQYQQPQYGGHQQGRGGGRGRGRGGNFNQGGRGDFHASQHNQHGGGYGPPQVGGGYMQQQQQPAPYIGPQAPNPGPQNGYQPQQWQEQPPQHQPVQFHHAPAAVPLSAQNYHPNYAPQVYQQPQQGPPQQYGPQQPPFQHQSPPLGSYGQHNGPPQQMHSNGPSQSQWQAPPPQAQPPYQGGGRVRGGARGGSFNRVGMDTPVVMPPIRMGFDNERGPEMPQASNGYGPSYGQSSPPNNFSILSHQPYAQNGFQHGRASHRESHDQNSFYPPNPQRGRGGYQGNRGRRDGHSGGFRGRGNHVNVGSFRPRDHSSGASQVPEQLPKATDDGSKSREGKKKKKKRKTNTLGLTPANEEHQDSEEEDDNNEEYRLTAQVSTGELSTWLAERRAKWPTKAKREAAAAALARRRAQAAEQSARDKAANKLRKEKEAADALTKAGEPATADTLDKQQKRLAKAEKLRLKLEKIEKKVQDAANSGGKRKRDTGDIGDEEDDTGDRSTVKKKVDLVDQVIAKVEAEANIESDSDSDSSSEGSTDSDDSDDSDESGPTAETSRQTGPVRVQPPQLPKKAILNRQCKYYSTGGMCGKKGKCRFIHDDAVRADALREKEMNGGRPTLLQRLVQNDNEKNSLTVLKSIQYLAKQGVLAASEPASAFAPEIGDAHNDGFVSQHGLPKQEYPHQITYSHNGYAHHEGHFNGPSPAYYSGLQYDGPADMNPFHSYDEVQHQHMDDEV